MNNTNSFPKIQKAQSTAKLLIRTEWDQSINSSIPITIRAEMSQNRMKTDITNKHFQTNSDVSYLKNKHKNFQSIESSIYKDPELSQTKYDKSLQSFYSTMYRKSQNRLQFKNKIEKTTIKSEWLDFEDLLKDKNLMENGLQKYFFDILKHEIKQSPNLSVIPPNRQQALDLKEWLFFMLQRTKDKSKSLTAIQIAEEIQLIYTSCFKEIIKQVKAECVERGELLQIIWDFYIQLIDQVIKSSNQQMQIVEQEVKNKMIDQQNFYNEQLHYQELIYNESKNQIKQIQFDYDRALDVDQQQKEEILQLTSEYREALEVIEQHRKQIDELQLQIVMLKTEQINENNPENEKINIKVQQGQSIVSHLMNFQAKIDNSQKYRIKSPFKSQGSKSPGRSPKKNSVIFDRWEQLRNQENQLKSQIISLKYLDFDKDQQPSQNKIIQISGTTDQYVQTDEDQIWNQHTNLQFQSDSTLEKAKKVSNDLEQKISMALKMLAEQELDENKKLLLCRTLSESKEVCEQNKSLSMRLITMNRLDSIKKMEILEKEELCQELEMKLQQTVQDFISIISNNKKKVHRLATKNTQLIGTLKQIESKYEIKINDVNAIEEEEFQNNNDMDQDGDYNEFSPGKEFQNLDDDSHPQEETIRMVDSINLKKKVVQKSQKNQNADSETYNNDQLEQIENGFNNQTYQKDIRYLQDMDNSQKQSSHMEFNDEEMLKDSRDQIPSDLLTSSHQKIKNKELDENTPLKNLELKSPTANKNSIKGSLTNQKSIQRISQQGDSKTINQQQYHLRNSKNQLDQNSMKLGKQNSKHNISNSPIREKDEISQMSLSQRSQAESQDDENNRAQRIKDVISQYKDKQFSKYSFVHKTLNYNLLQETKQSKRFRRVYSQNTDVANNLLKQVMNSKNLTKTLSFLQFNKIINQILTEVSKQSEAYKIPFHVCIYDFIKNKYGFKQVAEKKIKQIYEFIIIEKDKNTKVQLISKYCNLKNEIDEVAQKLLIEAFVFFNNKIESNKTEFLVTYESASEFLNEKSQLWLQANQIQQLQTQYKVLVQQYGSNKYTINFDQFIMKILDFYVFNKKDYQNILETLFKAADLDGNKLIEYQEFKTLYRAIHTQQVLNESLLQVFLKNADFADDQGDKYLTLPRFTEMAIELAIFPKESVIRYGEGCEKIKEHWETEKNTIKLRFLEAKQYSKVKHTFIELDNLINNNKKEIQNILWMSYKLLNEQSLRVYLKYQTQQCLSELLPLEILEIQQRYQQLDTIE
ncbi:unnamed protein product (macronuclear) [Paramecium tetraurelia]|uniref:EF-hand domain-containing protein n=1 Tax=Paramecium tetraurelia TaxID=5888 RepID=A0DQ89_PARTE|nr:uncharacterized protein GSPATT00002606001 [Paramecium tetraurelia]CAK85206.1 unnamed protein product [Paramecium tetraurelia]|eukprot:XP_001452603.1 hypothetical protein (macronuclear) [Paramecium tetraurelia strain d4-2]